MRMDDAAFEAWIEAQFQRSVPAMLRSVSAVDLVKERPGFAQAMRPARGSVIASPVFGAYDPDPDYCFHWFRDSAVVFDALRTAYEVGVIGEEALDHLRDFVRFSLDAQRLDGREAGLTLARRALVAEGFRRYLRSDAELSAVRGDRVVAESRINPDGTLDLTTWARPQHDGPPLRALACLRWWRHGASDEALATDLAALIRADLAFTHDHWHEASFDIWEEDRGHHYYDLRVASAALRAGAAWLADAGAASRMEKTDADDAAHFLEAAAAIEARLDDYWLSDAGHFRSRFTGDPAVDATKALDIALILAVIHADAEGSAHSVHDPRMQATLAHLAKVFRVRYASGNESLRNPSPIGRGDGVRASASSANSDAHPTPSSVPSGHLLPAGESTDEGGPPLGRYTADIYYGGKAWYVATLAAAEFCFRASKGAHDARGWIARGDAWLHTVRRYTPEDGALSEQFDPATGEQLSAKHLAWSYAAFISCVAARRAAMARS